MIKGHNVGRVMIKVASQTSRLIIRGENLITSGASDMGKQLWHRTCNQKEADGLSIAGMSIARQHGNRKSHLRCIW
jgi:hypothetical protein